MKRDRFLTGILAGILILIVLALALFFVRRDQAGYIPGDTPAAVVHNYVVALELQDYQRAYSYVDTSSGVPSFSAFQTSQVANRLSNLQTGLEIEQAQVQGDNAIVPITIVRVSGGPLADTYREPQTATLVRAQDGWKITSMAYPYWDFSWSPQNNPPVKPLPARP